MESPQKVLWQNSDSRHAVVQFLVGDYRNLVYLLVDWESGAAVMIDPHSGLKAEVMPWMRDQRLRLAGVALTHTHWDHVAGLPELLTAEPTLLVHVHAGDRHRLAPLEKQFPKIRVTELGQEFSVGGLEIKVIHAPGHSAGEVCFSLAASPPVLLTGDTLFVRECGRTDLESGDDTAMFATLQKIKAMDPTTLIFPGHHYAQEYWTVLGTELATSPPLQCASAEELAALP